jgi:hypothetical protein
VTTPARVRRARLDRRPAGQSAAQRAARGKAARESVPRQSHAAFEPEERRPDTVSLLEQQAASRVPALLPIRYGRMMASAFAFFRGPRSRWPAIWPQLRPPG